jgi:tetratricopeptide (TPR) repeat protein
VGLEVVFDESWDETEQLGLFLDTSASAMPSEGDGGTENKKPRAEDRQGYSFLIRPSVQEKAGDDTLGSPSGTFSAVREEGGAFVAEIFRDEACLQREGIDAADLPPGPLRIEAAKLENLLRFEVGTVRPIEFRDPFALRGTEGVKYALRWPPQARVVRVRGLRQALPVEPSELEKADWLYAQARFADALSAYREEAQARDATTGREAQYKAAMCLLALGRESEADTILEQLALEQPRAAGRGSPSDEPGDPWPALAACRLWSRRVRQRRFDEADALYTTLSAGYRSEDIAQMIPSQVRSQILGAYISQSKSLNLYRPHADAVRACQRAVSIAEFFDTSSWLVRSGHLRRCLLRAHRANNQEEEALGIAETLVRDPRAVNWPDVVIEYAWMLRVAGRPDEALAVLDDWIALATESSAPPREVIVERARTLAALDRWEEAEELLEEALRGVTTESPGWEYTAAWATLGFVREQLGDAAGAQQAWKQGLQVDWQTPSMGFRLVQGLILASLTGEFSDADTRRLMRRGLAWLPAELGENPVIQSFVPVELVTSVIHNTFRTPRGRQYARQIVLREIPFAECVRVPPMLVVAEGVRQGAMPETMTDEQQALVWQLVGDGYVAVTQRGSVGRQQLMWLAVTWTGAAGRFAWQAVAPTLDPPLRGSIAYVMGQRYLRLQLAEDAAFFFQTALDDASPDSPLEALAQAELDRLAPAVEPSSEAEKEAP